ncbi:MAG: hypothetical protein DMF84_28235 [Acidobacteria bacterium]|nr:MAG: hypothetical protein DMF84_28235 [Acidobacteriota bacterium]
MTTTTNSTVTRGQLRKRRAPRHVRRAALRAAEGRATADVLRRGCSAGSAPQDKNRALREIVRATRGNHR